MGVRWGLQGPCRGLRRAGWLQGKVEWFLVFPNETVEKVVPLMDPELALHALHASILDFQLFPDLVTRHFWHPYELCFGVVERDPEFLNLRQGFVELLFVEARLMASGGQREVEQAGHRRARGGEQVQREDLCTGVAAKELSASTKPESGGHLPVVAHH